MAGDLSPDAVQAPSQQLIGRLQIVMAGGGGRLVDLAHQDGNQFALGSDRAPTSRFRASMPSPSVLQIGLTDASGQSIPNRISPTTMRRAP